MPDTILVPAAQARALVNALEAIRGETSTLRAAGILTVSADELLDGAAPAHVWIADVTAAVEAAEAAGMGSPTVALPPAREEWQLQQLVYSLSAVLVWAHELRAEGRIATGVPGEALAAWAEVERAAGLGGRTSVAMGFSTGRLHGGPLPRAAAREVDLSAELAVEGVRHRAA